MNMDIKSILKKEATKALKKEAEKAIIKKATGKLLPMDDGSEKKMGWKATVAAALAFVAAAAAGLSQIIGG
jgi:phosphopantothenoylcysteine synthetase/decarboxylase